MMSAWDMWKNRNKILHAPDGPRSKDEHLELNEHIYYHFGRVKEDLDPSAWYWLENWPEDMLLDSDLITKRRWCDSMDKAWDYSELPDEVETLNAQQRFMIEWLHSNSTE